MATLIDNVFSRAGQNSREKFQILKQLNQVIFRRSHSQDVQPVHGKRKGAVRPLPPSVLKELLHIPLQDQGATDASLDSSQLREKSFIFAVQSRDDYYAAHTFKNAVPPCGHYNVSYAQVDRNKSVPKLVDSATAPKAEPSSCEPPVAVSSAPLLPKIPRKLIRMVPFSKQGQRKPLGSEFEGPHEKRFMASNLITVVSTKYKKSSSPDLRRTIPRSESLFAERHAAPEYEPNKETLMKDLGRVRLFAKMPKRKPIFVNRETPEGYEVNFKSVKPNTPNFNFSKLLARKPNQASPLPCFMHATCSRLALDAQTQKTYAMNCTNDSFFSTTTALGRSFTKDD